MGLNLKNGGFIYEKKVGSNLRVIWIFFFF